MCAQRRSDLTVSVGSLVGRIDEAAKFRRLLRSAVAGNAALALVEGEPGVGKTRLIEAVAAEAWAGGIGVIWGHCLEGDGAPSMWPWVEAVSAILSDLTAADRQKSLAGELGRLVALDDAAAETPLQPDGGIQFRLFEQVVDIVARAAARRPLMVVVDDLQWADVASARLFGHLAARLPTRVLLVGALRPLGPVSAPHQARMLAEASRASGHRRVLLGPLGRSDVAELVRRETGRTPSAGTVDRIHARTTGNPFFVRELARLVTTDGELAEDGSVPATVRDVVQDRMSGLDTQARALLQITALAGREIDIALLARVAGLDVPETLGHLEPVDALGLLGPVPGNPFSMRFAHDLIRESIAITTPRRQVPRLHLRMADALEATDPGGDAVAERLAHHLWAAGPLADPARTTAAMVHAGRRAMAKSAFEAAERHLRTAAQVARAARLDEAELSALSQLTLVVGMLAGYVDSPLEILERSEHLARRLGRDREAMSFLFTRFTGVCQGVQLEESARLARRLLDHGESSADPLVRVYGWLAWGMHQWESGHIGEAYRHVKRATEEMRDELIGREELPLLRDLKLLSAGMLGLMAMLHGEVAESRALYDAMEAEAGTDRYAITFWASFTVIAAAVAGDPRWALRSAERGIAADRDQSFAFLSTYPLLARPWGQAMTGPHGDSVAAELDRLITDSLLDPPRSSMTTWYAALAELLLADGRLGQAEAALDRADRAMEVHGERHSEGMILHLRALVLRAQGEPSAVVRAAAEHARRLSVEREAHLFAQRAEELLAEGR